MLRNIFTALAFIAAPVAAKADVWPLHQSGFWTTQLERLDNGVMVCSIGNHNPSEGRFFMSVDQGGKFMLMAEAFDATVGQGRNTIFLTIDGGRRQGTDWTLSDAVTWEEGTSAYFIHEWGYWDETTRHMVNDMRYHMNLAITDWRGNEIAFWSLRGSNAAIDAMFACFDRL